MPHRRRKFKRALGQRSYRKLYVIVAEGIKTEPQYFAIFNNMQLVIKVNCLRRRGGSSPDKVLKQMQDYIRDESLRVSDEAWLVVDKDEWTNDQLTALYDWSETGDNYGLALSNPKFEYWLLLHFEDGTGVSSSRECSERLRRHLPQYAKGIDPRRFTKDRIDAAIRRAESRDTPPCIDWPRGTGTTVYRLVKLLIRDVHE